MFPPLIIINGDILTIKAAFCILSLFLFHTVSKSCFNIITVDDYSHIYCMYTQSDRVTCSVNMSCTPGIQRMNRIPASVFITSLSHIGSFLTFHNNSSSS